MAVTFDFEVGGWDLWFTLPALSTGQWVKATFDGSAFTSADRDDAGREGAFKIERTADGFELSLLCTAGDTVEVFEYACSPAGAVEVRVMSHNKAISVTLNGMWAHTFWLAYVRHAVDPVVYLNASGAITVTDVRLVELYDGNEDVFIDVDGSSANALASTFGRRPIRTWPQYDGALCFGYDPPRAVVEARNVKRWGWTKGSSEHTGSDYLVFQREHVGLAVDFDALEDFGFVTRALRFPEQEHGAISAATKLQEQGRQEQLVYECAVLLLPALELYDVVDLYATASGALAGVEDNFIAEKVSVEVGSGKAGMTIEGRQE